MGINAEYMGSQYSVVLPCVNSGRASIICSGRVLR